MPPGAEVRAGDNVGIAGDLFSVAAIAAELLQTATGATTTALRTMTTASGAITEALSASSALKTSIST